MTHHAADTSESYAVAASLLERARRRDLSLGDLIQVAESLMAGEQTTFGAELYKTWIAYNADHPLVHMASFNYSIALRRAGDLTGAIHALSASVRSVPDFGPARINLGRAFEDSGVIDAALAQWRGFVEGANDLTADRLAHKLMALQHIGRVCENAERLSEAEQSLWQAIELRPDKPEAAQHWISVRQRLCLWPVLKESEHVAKRQLLAGMSPISLACYTDDPLFQLAKAYRYGQSFVGRPDVTGFVRNPVRKVSGTSERLRVGFVSSDLRSHAVGFALSEVLEWRDASRIETFAYYIGEVVHADPTQQRLKASFDHWRDLAGTGDRQAAEGIARDAVDILIDVNGYTKHARTAIFAFRPAPVIVNWCGYPGTMGSPWHHYLIADPQMIPAGNEIYFSEKILHIGCNQPVDRKRDIDPATPTRAEAGLPEGAFVFASLNGMQKITERCFLRWMAILALTPGSVLWLLSGGEDAHSRLRAVAGECNIDPARLIFAPKAANPQHMARMALADLFLDTSPYGAHSTAADALTMGVPVLTFAGRSLASRFCSSVVLAAGVSELICSTPEDYVGKAVALAHEPAALAAVRARLLAARETCVLRDMRALARRLQELFFQMQDKAERGETPAPDLTNLDVYYEIGADLGLTDAEALDESAYRELYRDRLEAWNACTPIPCDRRLWMAPSDQRG